MGMRLCKGIAPVWFQPKGCPAEFLLRPLDNIDYMELQMSINTNGEVTASAMRRALQKSIVDWKGVDDENGEQARFDISRFGDIPREYLGDLITHVVEISKLREDEKKA